MRTRIVLAALAALLPGAPPAAGLDLELYADLLERHTARVEDLAGTRVDYAGLRDAPRWERLVASLEASDPEELETRAERIAFWVNAYNILAIELVVEHDPEESIRDVGSWLRPVWERPVAEIGGRSVTLDWIEHDLLRPLGDPRIHGAIVCASLSCPPLRRKPYRAEALDAQLDASLRRFLADPRKGLRLDRAARTVHLSRIFEWFEEDFEPAGGPLAFATRYVSEERRDWLEAHEGELRVRYLEYDWRLNALRPLEGARLRVRVDGRTLRTERTPPPLRAEATPERLAYLGAWSALRPVRAHVRPSPLWLWRSEEGRLVASGLLRTLLPGRKAEFLRPQLLGRRLGALAPRPARRGLRGGRAPAAPIAAPCAGAGPERAGRYPRPVSRRDAPAPAAAPSGDPPRPLWRDDAPIRVGVSSCLLGREVRWDGGHKRDRFLTDQLDPYVEWVPVCPEQEVGMGTPREPVHLLAGEDGPRMVAEKSERDWTGAMRRYAERRARQLRRLELCGYVLKRDSPSCGMERVKVRSEKGMPRREGRGLFAAALMEALPSLPVEEEGRLHDARLRENFIERVFAYRRLRSLLAGRFSRHELVAFHTAHKLQLLAHSPKDYHALGRLVAEAKQLPVAELRERYERGFMEALRHLATPRRNTNVLEHCLGYFKRELDASARAEMKALVEDYRRGLVPLVVPLTLIRHYVERVGVDYLRGQVYLEPHPKELMLRNHV